MEREKSLFKASESAITWADEKSILSADFTAMQVIYTSEHGHSVLWRAQRLGKWHVLKGLKPEKEHDPVCRSLLIKEFEIGFKLSHPNIVQTYGIEEVKGAGLCIVMEYVDGENLRERLLKGHLRAAEVKNIINQLLDATEYLHQKQIIHRDLKPENIMLTANGGHVKVVDFGYADADAFAILKQPAGTRTYAAPEQMNGIGVDLRADIFAVGKIMNELTANLSFFKANFLHRVAQRCTRPNRDERYANDNALRQAVNSHPFSNLFYVSLLIAFTLLIAIAFYQYQGANQPAENAAPHPITQTTDSALTIQSQQLASAQSPSAHSQESMHKKPTSEKQTSTASDEKLDYLTSFAHREALAEMRKATAIERDTAISVDLRATASNRAVLLLQEKVKKEVARVVGSDSPQYALYLSATMEALMQTVRDYNKKKYNLR